MWRRENARYLVGWFVSSSLHRFARLVFSLLDALPILTEVCLFKVSASSSSDIQVV